ncbi:MAG: hypothetical protein WAZ14_00525 [Patescibacteria group bacterium]
MRYMFRLKNSARKLLPLLLVGIVFFSASSPRFASAQAPATAITTYPAFEAWAGINSAGEKIKDSLAGTIMVYLINLMTFAADRLAYDTAVMVASGGPAETPLYDGTPIERYFKEYGAAVAGESLGLLQDNLEAGGGALGAIFSGFNLCQPRADITIALSLGVKAAFERPVPKCDFKAISSNWNGFLADIQDEGTADNKNKLVLAQLANAFEPDQSEFAVGIELQSSILNNALQESFLRAQVHIKDGGTQSVTDFITGQIETPASLIEHKLLVDLEGPGTVRTETTLALMQSERALLQVGIHAGSVFTNTLLSSLTKKLGEGLFKIDSEISDPFASLDSIARSNSDTARDQFRSLITVAPLEISNYSILSEFGSCPSGVPRGLYNCVANNSFISAVGRAEAGAPLTVAEALEQNLISGSWPLIPAADLARNQDPFCYTYGFCQTNLVKLRKARIISIGWELAAESQYNSVTDAVTLQEVVDGFDDCNTAGEIDATHPWCKLIDPNWVIKYPETQCKALVSGQLLVASDIAERQNECVDMPSCIAENDDGTCTGGYGYCVQEENTWRFRGESCPAEYASCLTFEGEDKTASYLQNTVDFAGCTADNAGCLWYDTVKADPEGDGTYDWQPVADVAVADAAPDAYTSRIYFTSAVEDCSAENGGCAELYARNPGISLNVVQNSSFEDDQNNDTVPDAWQRGGVGAAVNSDNSARSGSDAIDPSLNGELIQPGIALAQGRFYTVSFYARQKTEIKGVGSNSTGTLALEFLALETGNDINLNGTSFFADANTTCVIANSGNVTNGNGLADVFETSGTPTGTEYESFACTFTSPILRDPAATVMATLTLSGNVFFDDIQLEQGEGATDYHEGYSTSQLSSVSVKVPPSYLGCQGNAADPAECANYAQVCSENEVGCTAYTPTNGDPTVTGVASELDACPAICVGYDTFKQEATLYEPAGTFPVYFIPTTGESCSQEYVGCDEFTNLSTEALEYYTYLRACVTPTQAAINTNGDNQATFYTWEGSDLEGYQLKTWSLLESNMASTPYTYMAGGIDSTPSLAPCSVWSATADGIVCSDELDSDGDLKKDWDTAACNEHEDIFSNPDCREFYDTSGGIHYRLWSKTVSVNAACSAYRKTELVGTDAFAQAANCQNSGGYFDDLTGTCRYNGYSEESVECPDSANGCRSYTGGRSRNSRIAFEDTLEGGDLNNWDAASAADVTLSNESLATGGHSIAATNQFSTFIFDNGSVCATPGGCSGTAQSFGGNCVVIEGNTYCGTLENQLFQGKTYTLSFWAKGTGDLTAAFDLAAVPGSSVADVAFGTVKLTSGWQQFSLGPLNMTREGYANFGPATTLVFDPTSLAYIDNITLREGEDDITLIKDSWVTPAACDQAPTGAASPQYYLGCQEYNTQDNQIAYLKSFSSLCSSDKVGCEDFFMTHESSSPFAEVYQATCSNPGGAAVTSPASCYYKRDGAGGFDLTSQYLCTIGVGQTACNFDIDWYQNPNILPSHITYGPETVVVPADSDVFLVVDESVTCSSAYAGCTEVGKPEWSQDRNSTLAAESVFLMNDPDQYAQTLCNAGELFCAAWDTQDDGTFFFKDPVNQTCGYRTDVLINGAEYDGWFRAGTDEFCYGTCTDGVTSCSSDAQCGAGSCNTTDPSYVIGGTLSGVWRNGDDQYGGWVGECPSNYNSCSEFQDPLDLETDERYQLSSGKQYFYLNNDNLDENVLPDSQRCDGRASLKEGCVLFNDTSEPAQKYNASASEVLSTHADVLLGTQPFALVEPIDCEGGNSRLTLADGTQVDLCAQRCLYDKGMVRDIADGVPRNIKLSLGGLGVPKNYDDLYLTGTSCYDVSDCGTMRSQSGDEIAAFDCNTRARATSPAAPGGAQAVAVPRLENDTNTVLKVNRDRQCSEWLSCAEDMASWDQRTNSWKTVCTDIQLCTKYSSSGGSTFCSAWKEDASEVILDAGVYTSRDVSWYGQEYSGYAIPDIFPVQTLEQANVSPPPGSCDLSDAYASGLITEDHYQNKHGYPCEQETSAYDCGIGGTFANYCVVDDAEDYRLALVAGECSGSYGSSCSVGYCQNTGSACASTTDCGLSGGSCIAGSCQVQTGTLCATDSNCAADQICSGSQCVSQGGKVTIETFNAFGSNPNGACAAGQVFVANTALKVGSCVRDQCILTPDGKTFNVALSEGKVCRAQPESDAPFSFELVERWADPDNNGAPLPAGEGFTQVEFPKDDVPYQIRAGFQEVNLCAPGEDCQCSYRKLTYGEGAQIRYWDVESAVTSGSGLCTTGKVNAACQDDAECNTATDSEDGTCSMITREDTLLGLEGYCLERDTGVNINGDRSEGACLTWLPVDQLAGSTDLYAKFTEAGYFEDTFACSYVSPMANLKMSGYSKLGAPYSSGDIACAESGQEGIADDEAYSFDIAQECAANAQCPEGYWALLGMPSYKEQGNDGTMSQACATTGAGNDCPFVCIPKDAVSLEGESCNSDSAYVAGLIQDIEGDLEALSGQILNFTFKYNLANDAEIMGMAMAKGIDDANALFHYISFDLLVEALSDCTLKGVEVNEAVDAAVFDTPEGGGFVVVNGIEVPTDVYRDLYMKAEFYAACKEVTRVSDGGTKVDYAWTDRLLGPDKETSFPGIVADPTLDFVYGTNPGPYGFVSIDPSTLEDEWPLVVAACEETAAKSMVHPGGPAPYNNCAYLGGTNYSAGGGSGDTGVSVIPSNELLTRINPATADARSFIGFAQLHANRTEISNWGVSGFFDDVFGSINQLFAGVSLPGIVDNQFSWNSEDKTWPDNERKYDEGDIENFKVDESVFDVRAEQGNPPKVMSILNGSCVGTLCEEGSENALTLNDQNSGNVEGEDFLRAYLKFYAAADKNQLPIRRVVIDWGDGIESRLDGFQGSDSTDNFYRNHRGIDGATDTSICDQGDEWGETPESCDPNYFSYSHTYTCSSQITSDTAKACQYKNGVATNSPCWIPGEGDTKSCVFQPAVHIRDNWGWCTGTCTADGDPGCYEGDAYNTLSNATILQSECSYNRAIAPGGPVDPWVYYQGTVIVN